MNILQYNSIRQKFAFDQSSGDEVLEKTKGCADEMSICAASSLIAPLYVTIEGCINCCYYSESRPGSRNFRQGGPTI